MEEFLLKVTEDQDALSKEILSAPIKEIADSTIVEISTNKVSEEIEETSEEEAVYDIYLRESARIMTDWVRALEKPKAANYL